MNIHVRANLSNDELYCVYCKQRIEIGEKFATKTEVYGGEKFKLNFHLECLEEEE